MTEPTTLKSVLRTLARHSTAPVWRRLRPRIETIAAHRSEIIADELRAEFARRDEELYQRLTAHLEFVLADAQQRHDVVWRQVHERVAALERPPVDPIGDDADHREARSLVEEVRAEHARARVRLTAIARYEERITRLEQALTFPQGSDAVSADQVS